ncbi:MAG: hypothetical protein N3A01_06620 [Bacteroidales bacterium]|nr:hypothetical protein [Bacteroidales bacterium]
MQIILVFIEKKSKIINLIQAKGGEKTIITQNNACKFLKIEEYLFKWNSNSKLKLKDASFNEVKFYSFKFINFDKLFKLLHVKDLLERGLNKFNNVLNVSFIAADFKMLKANRETTLSIFN